MRIIGLDPGTDTGVARWDCPSMKMLDVQSMVIHRAMEYVRHTQDLARVIFEDARLRKCFDKMDREQAKYGAAVREGAGMAKRDAAIWEDYLLDIGVPFIARAPRYTKYNSDYFKACTGWTGRTNEHGRDAGMLITGVNMGMAQSLLATAKQRAAAAG